MIDCDPQAVVQYAQTHRDWNSATQEQRYVIVCSAAVAAMQSEAEMVIFHIEDEAYADSMKMAEQLEAARSTAARYEDILSRTTDMPAGVVARGGQVDESHLA